MRLSDSDRLNMFRVRLLTTRPDTDLLPYRSGLLPLSIDLDLEKEAVL